jgi:hypothetical protein
MINKRALQATVPLTLPFYICQGQGADFPGFFSWVPRSCIRRLPAAPAPRAGDPGRSIASWPATETRRPRTHAGQVRGGCTHLVPHRPSSPVPWRDTQSQGPQGNCPTQGCKRGVGGAPPPPFLAASSGGVGRQRAEPRPPVPVSPAGCRPPLTVKGTSPTLPTE